MVALFTGAEESEETGFFVPQAYRKGVEGDEEESAAVTLILETEFVLQNWNWKRDEEDFACTNLELVRED